ncbi:MAG: polyhydroxyalkanoic acid system family protein [Bradymonadales bacterium]|nr:polyhydroxyalkanoic acid system family protein [Bradymonadales bacterium]
MAKKVNMEVAHALPLDDALARMRALTDYFQNKYGAIVAWDGAKGSIKVRQLMIDFQYDFVVDDRKVLLEGTDPGFLLRKTAYDYLDQKMKRYLDPANPLDSLPRR